MRTAPCTFQDLVDAGFLAVGDGYRAKNEELGGRGPIFLRAAYLQDSGFTLLDPDRFQITEVAGFGPKLSRLGDVVITTKGNSTGRIGKIREEQVGAVYSPHLSYWRSLDEAKIDQCFLYYWSQSSIFREQLVGMAHSTDMAPYLSLRDQLRLRLALPPISTQRTIGEILGALDDKIELNRRMNETLEAMARSIFKDWFVYFGPTRAKMTGRKPYLAPDLWSLFPDRLDARGLPEGWEVRAVYDHADFINGAAYKDMHFSADRTGWPVIKIAELKNGVTGQTRFTPTELGDKYKIDTGELLFSWSGNPDTSIDTFIWAGGPAWLNQHIFAVRTNGTASKAHLYLLLRHLKPEFAEIARNKQTTGLGHVTVQDLKRLEMACPDRPVLRVFEGLVAPLVQRMESNLLECKTLAVLRDLLLPKLMSGEIRVRDAENLVGGAV